jgi:hypothetical protein
MSALVLAELHTHHLERTSARQASTKVVNPVSIVMAHPTNKATDELDVGGHTSTQVGARLSLQHKSVAFFPLSLSQKIDL